MQRGLTDYVNVLFVFYSPQRDTDSSLFNLVLDTNLAFIKTRGASRVVGSLCRRSDVMS